MDPGAMPRRNRRVVSDEKQSRPKKSYLKRGAYRADMAAAIARLEARRKRMGVSHQALAAQAGIALSTWERMRRDGRAFLRHVTAVRMALRSLDKEARALEAQYGGEE